MALTKSQKSTIRRKARSNQLEVEHLLKIARIGDRQDIELLQSLSEELNWPHTGFVGGSRYVPFARWVDVICEYLYGGYERLYEVATSQETSATHARFCVPVLEELRTAESVSTLLEIASNIDYPRLRRTLKLKSQIADALSMILCLKNPPKVSQDIISQVREYLHELLSPDLLRHEQATVIYAMRGVGDQSTLALLRKVPKFEFPWEDVPSDSIRKIKKRLRDQSSSAAD